MIIKNVEFNSRFCLGSIADKFDENEFTKVSFKENEHDFYSITVVLIKLKF